MHTKIVSHFKNYYLQYYKIPLGYPPGAFVDQAQLTYAVPMTAAAQSYPSGVHMMQDGTAVATIKQGSNIANYAPIQPYADQVIWFITFYA